MVMLCGCGERVVMMVMVVMMIVWSPAGLPSTTYRKVRAMKMVVQP